jgi:flagellar hook-associated protein 3 FlgL
MADVSRVSTLNQHQVLLANSMRSQQNLYDLQTQLSSGQRSQTFAGLQGDTESFLDLERRISRSEMFVNSNKIIQSRLNITDSTLGSIIDTATDLKNLIQTQRTGAVGNGLAFDTQIVGKWKELATEFNTTSEGRYIFSGTRTDVQAVDADNFPSTEEDGVPDDGYYQGSQEDISVRVDDNISITYNVRADSEPFQKIAAGLALARKYGQTSGESDNMKRAYDLISEGIDGVISTRAEVNANNVVVTNNIDRLDSMKLYWQGLKEDIGNADLVSVSTEVAINQGILQASYQAFARISALKLSDYLR